MAQRNIAQLQVYLGERYHLHIKIDGVENPLVVSQQNGNVGEGCISSRRAHCWPALVANLLAGVQRMDNALSAFTTRKRSAMSHETAEADYVIVGSRIGGLRLGGSDR